MTAEFAYRRRKDYRSAPGGRLEKLRKADTGALFTCEGYSVWCLIMETCSILSVLDAMDASVGFQRPIREGEQVLNGGLVVAVGLKERNEEDETLHIQALVLRTSGITKKTPAVVEIWVDLKKPYGSRVIKDSSPECDCPAGNSAKCKHIMAVMLCLARLDESDLEDLSCTDIEQQWGQLKKSTLQEYEGKRLSDLCHVNSKRDVYVSNMPEVTKEMEARWREKLLNCAALSEYSLFISGVRTGLGVADTPEDAVSRQAEDCNIFRRLLTFRSWSVLGQVKKLTDEKLLTLDPALLDFYENNVAVSLEGSVDIANFPQRTDEWYKARGVRLTATRARAQYTYYVNRNADWDARYKEVYKSNFTGSDFTIAGLRCEGPARDKYEEDFQCRVFETGLLVRPEVPWLGASLDGTALSDDGQFLNNIEIKTLKEGQRLTANELFENKCIKTLDENGNVKEKNSHYAQMQIGMLLSGMEMCDYVVYSEAGSDSLYSRVLFNDSHVLELCSRLVHVYFDKFLPRMVIDHS